MRRIKINPPETKPDMSFNRMVPRTRRAIELGVVAYNNFLKEQVNEMSDITLLRNMHPLDRSFFAKQLHTKGLLSKDELAEFSNVD